MNPLALLKHRRGVEAPAPTVEPPEADPAAVPQPNPHAARLAACNALVKPAADAAARRYAADQIRKGVKA